jgi:hypothetical protein
MIRKVEAILVHYRRPGNIRPIIERLRSQTLRPTITLIDAHDRTSDELDHCTYQLADKLIRINFNSGSFNRFLSAYAIDSEFSYFCDDDMLPGDMVIEFMLASFLSQRDCGVLGQFGRMIKAGSYENRNITRSIVHTEVDVVVRSYFVRTSTLAPLLALRHMLPPSYWVQPCGEDDILLAGSLQIFEKKRAYIAPNSLEKRTWSCMKELAANDALCMRADHYQRRQTAVNWLRTKGWSSVEDRLENRDIETPAKQ